MRAKKKCSLIKRYRRMYKSWADMKSRCYNPKCKSYKDYGGRGISVCYEWQESFESFFMWAMTHGYKEGLEIDRIDVNGHYEPENCKWSNESEQSFNQRPQEGQKYPAGISWKKKDKIFSVDICGEHLGSTKSLEEAIEMRRKAEIERFGFSKMGIERKIVPRKYEDITRFKNVSTKYKEEHKKLYNIWSNLKHINKKEFSLRYNEWLSFEDFVKWSKNNGYKEGLHLLRYDKSKPYTVDNCVFSEFTRLNLSSNYLKYRGRYKKN